MMEVAYGYQREILDSIPKRIGLTGVS